MIRVAVTGGIGSGKSLICQIFSKLGVPIYYADIYARMLAENDPDIRKKLIALLGPEVYTGASLNRPVMSTLIFNNKPLLEKVNRIIHPRVAEQFLDWCLQHSGKAYVIQESAILFESNAYRLFDRIVMVSSPEHLRIRRTLNRKDMTLEKIKSIMQNQLPEEEKILRSQHVVINDDITPVLPQVLSLHQVFMNQE